MPKYKVTMRETIWNTYVFESGESDEQDAYERFLAMTHEEQEAAKVSVESYEWELDEIERVEKIK